MDIERLKVDPDYWDEVAPEIWATEYNLDDGFFFSPKGHWGMSNGGWVSFYKPSTYDLIKSQSNCVSRPTKPAAPEWNGDGYPHVGCECECQAPRLGSPKWERCRVIGPNGRFIVCLLLESGGFAQFEPNHLRPIRTKAQRERDELAKLLQLKDTEITNLVKPIDRFHAFADAIIAAGYSKQEGGKP